MYQMIDKYTDAIQPVCNDPQGSTSDDVIDYIGRHNRMNGTEQSFVWAVDVGAQYDCRLKRSICGRAIFAIVLPSESQKRTAVHMTHFTMRSSMARNFNSDCVLQPWHIWRIVQMPSMKYMFPRSSMISPCIRSNGRNFNVVEIAVQSSHMERPPIPTTYVKIRPIFPVSKK